MKKILISLFIALFFIILPISSIAYAVSWAFSFPTTITDTSNTTRTYYPINLGVTGQTYINGGYITSSGLNSNMQLGATSLPYTLSTTNMTTVIPNLPSGGKAVVSFYTGYTPLQTNFSIITGDLGYVTTADNITEPTDNHSEIFKGYVDTTAGSYKYLVNKTDYRVMVSPNTTGTILAQVSQNNSGVFASYAVGATDIQVYGANWDGQLFYLTASNTSLQYEIFGVVIHGFRVGTNPGIVTASLRSVTGTTITTNSTDLASGTSNGNTWNLTPAQDQTILFDNPYIISNNTSYGIVLRATTGNSTDYVTWSNDGGGAYPNGSRNFSVNSGSTWTDLAIQDHWFQLLGVGWGVPEPAVITSVPSGYMTLESQSNSIYLWLTSDTTTAHYGSSNMTTKSIQDNAYSWYWLKNNVAPYMNSINMTKGGNPQVFYSPNTMIIGNDLIDRESTGGLNDGLIIWGTNRNVSLHAGVMVSNNSTSSTGQNTTVGFNMPPMPLPTNWFGTATLSPNLPFYDEFLAVSISSGMSLRVIYFIVVLGLAILFFLMTAMFTKSNLLSIVVFNSFLYINTSSGVVPMWVAFGITLVQAGIMYLSRQM